MGQRSLLDTGREALSGALFMSVVCLLFDVLWNEIIPREHSWLIALVVGLAHGALLLSLLGGFLGSLKGSARTRRFGAVGGLICGLVASLSFYACFPLLMLFLKGKWAYMAALGVSWLSLWQLFATLQNKLNGRRFDLSFVLLRGSLAGVLSAPGFAVIIKLWMGASAGYAYGWAFLAWFFAWGMALSVLLHKRVVGK